MTLNRNKLYAIMGLTCAAGYAWLYFSFSNIIFENKSVDVCIIKHVTNIPCPSCGSTRSVILLSKGNFIEALLINPFGYIVAIIMLLAPLWIIIDIATKKKTLFELYQKIEIKLQKPKYAIPLILVVIFNWIWNITKGI